jgi:dextranase
MIELLPTKATFSPSEPVEVEVRGADGVEVTLLHLDRVVATVTSDGGGVAGFGPQPEGGYGVESGAATSALDVLADPLSRPRYGFVSNYTSGRETATVADEIRRFHLNAIQFYDWMYRHAELLPPEDDFEDALGRELSLDTVRRLVETVRAAGSLPFAYAAVYAVGRDVWRDWEDEGLYHADGSPWMLGDFLWNVDPASPRWLHHFTGQLAAAAREVGFAGFHLDQYGAPKRALRSDGSVIDLAEAFPTLIDAVAAAVPDARLIFNNVNDFPVWTTTRAHQAATYIEVWSPHDSLGHLAGLITKARSLAPGRAVILAAYLSTYKDGADAGVVAERLQLATAFSHGGTTLLHGEANAVLTDPYYVEHAELGAAAREAGRLYYDFAVRYGDLLFDEGSVDVTRTHLAGVNEEIRIEAAVPVATDPVPGVLWTRALEVQGGLLLSLIDLSPQDDDRWDAPKAPERPLEGVRVRLERAGREAPRFAFATPEAPRLRLLESAADGHYDVVELPAFSTWGLVWIPALPAEAPNTAGVRTRVPSVKSEPHAV